MIVAPGASRLYLQRYNLATTMSTLKAFRCRLEITCLPIVGGASTFNNRSGPGPLPSDSRKPSEVHAVQCCWGAGLPQGSATPRRTPRQSPSLRCIFGTTPLPCWSWNVLDSCLQGVRRHLLISTRHSSVGAAQCPVRFVHVQMLHFTRFVKEDAEGAAASECCKAWEHNMICLFWSGAQLSVLCGPILLSIVAVRRVVANSRRAQVCCKLRCRLCHWGLWQTPGNKP